MGEKRPKRGKRRAATRAPPPPPCLRPKNHAAHFQAKPEARGTRRAYTKNTNCFSLFVVVVWICLRKERKGWWCVRALLPAQVRGDVGAALAARARLQNFPHTTIITIIVTRARTAPKLCDGAGLLGGWCAAAAKPPPRCRRVASAHGQYFLIRGVFLVSQCVGGKGGQGAQKQKEPKQKGVGRGERGKERGSSRALCPRARGSSLPCHRRPCGAKSCRSFCCCCFGRALRVKCVCLRV